MAEQPINKRPKARPINLETYETKPPASPKRKEDEAIAVAVVTGTPVADVEKAINDGNRTVVTATKRQIGKQTSEGFAAITDQAYQQGIDPENTALLLADEKEKQRQFYESGDNLYFDQALTLGDANVSAEMSRFATNMQIGQELFEQAMAEEAADTGWVGYAADFVDRYFLRAFPIGGIEQVTNRNERKGIELMNAALSLSPGEYEAYIKGYLNELKQEGIFRGDNIFALADGFAELNNAGYDENELLNRTVGVLDLTPALAVAKVIKATTPLRRVAAIKGPEAAADAGEAMLRQNPAPNPRVVNDLKPSALDPGRKPDVLVPANRDVRIQNENAIIQEVIDINVRGGFGLDASSRAVKEAYSDFISSMGKNASNRLIEVDIYPDATGNFRTTLQVGTIKSGRPFNTKAGAEKSAKKIREDYPTAEVKPVDRTDDSAGFYIEINDILDPFKFSDDLSDSMHLNALQKAYARFAGSKAATEADELNQLAVLAEGIGSAMTGGRAMQNITRTLQSVSAKSSDVISKVYSDLRDGKDAFLREHYTDAEFKLKFKENHPEGQLPTEKDIDAFHAVRTVNDAAYMMRAHLRLQKVVANDYYALTFPDGAKALGRITDEALGDTPIFDMQAGTMFIKRDLHPKTKVWQLNRELEGGIEYVVNPGKVSAPSHSDVLPYNAGGRRINPTANYFVTLGEDAPRAFVTAVSREQAETAVEQIKNIQSAIRESGDITGNTRKLDEVVRANNDWNEELQSFEDFTKFAKDKRLDFTKPVNFKNRDGEIRTGEVKDFFSATWDEYVTFDMHRSDDTLIEFGGRETMNYDPVGAMFRDFGSISQHYAHNVYTQTALNTWLKAAGRKGSGWDVPSTGDPFTRFNRATQTETTNNRASELGRQHAIIRRRLGVKSEAFQHMESYGAELQEWLFNKAQGGIKLLPEGQLKETAKRKAAGIPRDPGKGAAQSALNVGFQSAFGFGNVGQFFVQGYHALTIAAMTQDSLLKAGSGLKGLTMTPAVRAILMGSKDATTEALMIDRLARWAGQSVDEMEETIDFIRTSGRDILDGSLLEHGTGTQWNISGWKGDSYLPSSLKDATSMAGRAMGGALKAGLTPFREGERMARLTGINTAIVEYRAAFPKASLNTAHARKWISNREHALGLRMSNANRAFMQEGFGKLPTQWFSYTLRAMEHTFIGKDLTKGERARLFSALFPAFGLTGMGAASVTDWVAETMGAEPAGQMYTFIKRGILDTLVEGISGGEVELALAERLAPWTLVQDVYKNVHGQKTAFEIALGPSGDIISNILGSLIEVGGEFVNGNSVSMTEDFVRVGRQLSGVDNVFKAVGIWQNGMYRSRTGKTLPFELDSADAWGQIMGFTPREVNEWYQEKGMSYRDSRDLKNFQTEVEIDWSRAQEMWDKGERDRAIKYMKEIEYKIVMSGFSPYEQMKLRRAMRTRVDDSIYRMFLDYYRKENPYRAEVLAETFGG